MVQHQQLKEVGSKLESPPASKDALIKLLKVTGGIILPLWILAKKKAFLISLLSD